MRALISLAAGFVIAAFAVLASGGPVAYASFHCMRIHAVLGSYNGDPNVQYVELRMDFPSQVFLATHTIQFRDAAGTLKATFTFPAGTFQFGASVANFATGDSILVATHEFNLAATGGAADFEFSNANTTGANGGDPLHPVQGPGGKIGWAQGFDNCDADIIASPGEVDSLAYGTATADFGTAAAPLPGATGNVQGLRLGNLNQVPADNSTEYSLQHVALSTLSVASSNLVTNLGTPRNNSRVILALPSVGPVGGMTPTAVATATPTATSRPTETPTLTATATIPTARRSPGGSTATSTAVPATAVPPTSTPVSVTLPSAATPRPRPPGRVVVPNTGLGPEGGEGSRLVLPAVIAGIALLLVAAGVRLRKPVDVNRYHGFQ